MESRDHRQLPEAREKTLNIGRPGRDYTWEDRSSTSSSRYRRRYRRNDRIGTTGPSQTAVLDTALPPDLSPPVPLIRKTPDHARLPWLPYVTAVGFLLPLSFSPPHPLSLGCSKSKRNTEFIIWTGKGTEICYLVIL